MSKLVTDQADGLRRLLARTPTRVIAVAGMGRGVGATTTAMNLAAALVHQGKQVLLLDEHDATPASACALWSIAPSGTLADVAGRRLACEETMALSDCGVGVLPARPDAQPAGLDPRTLWQGSAILIDAALDGEGCLSMLARQADDLVLVFRPQPASITAAYAGIKRLHYAHALKQLRLLVNGVGAGDEAAQVMTNLVDTSRRYLAVSLQPAGGVRADRHLRDAQRLHQTVVEAFPASPAAIDFRGIAAGIGQWPWRAAALRPPPAGRTHGGPGATPARDTQASNTAAV
ncbi:AAA family ATPase [Variovorax sp. PBL-E5]|uniref:AAA family ATPase n=1 Tax=Variovorax sp. PBL-E5 TaxID=434014 RepID=UPI0013166840|nr:AAA family ATPase [Variovorax sp. PBL-E5]VTU33241.1 Flagellum site-determining protein YlxH [Variovorax sp. PBL-E5]